MFYFDEFCGKKVLKSDYLGDITHFFTTREGIDFENLKPKRVITPVQTHSSHVQIVDKRDNYPDTDGLIITNPNDAIYLRFADCTPLIFYDSKNNIAAIAHAGWRGTAEKIGVKTVQRMGKNFGTNPKDVIAVIGPAISICCYEVSYAVRDALLKTSNDTTNLYIERNVDLKKINARQLQEIGVEKIDICPFCTCCEDELFYSYRRENGTPNRHYAVVAL